MSSVSMTDAGIVYSDSQTPTGVSGASVVSEVLDHYEEGTWTPTNTNSGSLVGEVGRYIRVGRMVYLQGYFQTHGTTTVSNTFGGIPFAIGSTEAGRSGGWASYNSNQTDTLSILLSSSGNYAFTFYKGASVIVFGTTEYIYFSIQYIVD